MRWLFLREQCTKASKRTVSRHLYEEALERMKERVTPSLMGLRRSIVDHPVSTSKYQIFGHPRLLLRGRSGASVEIGLAVMAYNIKRKTNVLGAQFDGRTPAKLSLRGSFAKTRAVWPSGNYFHAAIESLEFRNGLGTSSAAQPASGGRSGSGMRVREKPKGVLPAHKKEAPDASGAGEAGRNAAQAF
jgi:hypothetical protein